MSVPPLTTAYVIIRDITDNDPFFGKPAVIVTLESDDPLTKTFTSRFYDLIANRMLVRYIDTAGRAVWLPERGVNMSISVFQYDCDWPLVAVILHPRTQLVLFSRNDGKCTGKELFFLSIEYKSKIPFDLYFKPDKNLMYSETTKYKTNQLSHRINRSDIFPVIKN